MKASEIKPFLNWRRSDTANAQGNNKKWETPREFKYLILLNIILLFLLTCHSEFDKSNKQLRFLLLRDYPKKETLLTIEEQDIKRVDWQNQCYYFRDSIVELLNNFPGMGASPYYFVLTFGNTNFVKINIFSSVSSVSFDESCPFVSFDKNSNSVLINNRFCINYFKSQNHSKTIEKFNNLFDKDLRKHLMDLNLLINY